MLKSPVYSNRLFDNESIFLILQHLFLVKKHSGEQLVLLYQVYSNCCLYYELIFLIYLHSLQVINHSRKQLLLLYQVYTNSLFLSSTDVPFTNGQFTLGCLNGQYCAFSSLSCSGITSDSGLFLIIHFIHSLYKPI